VSLSYTVPDVSSRCPPDVCVAAVLGDALRRVAVLGGREGMPWSLGSVYGGVVTRFLGGGLRDTISHVVVTPHVRSVDNGVVVSVDGATVLVSNCALAWHAIHEFNIADGSLLRVVGGRGDGPLRFNWPRQVNVAPDGFVFVAEWGNHRVQVLTPTIAFHGFVGVGHVDRPTGVCANSDVVIVAHEGGSSHRVSVFNRGDGALLRCFGPYGTGDGQLSATCGLCFVHGDRHVAVADSGNNRVSIFSVGDGEFVCHVGVGVLKYPRGVACSAFDELVVADTGNRRVVVFSGSGELLSVVAAGEGDFTGVAVHGGSLYAHDCSGQRCVVFLW
jgi:DNA-binding beta-propeller fold protein YncE